MSHFVLSEVVWAELCPMFPGDKDAMEAMVRLGALPIHSTRPRLRWLAGCGAAGSETCSTG